MQTEELEALKKRNTSKGGPWTDGYCKAYHDVADRLLEDHHELGEDADGDERTRVLRSYLVDMARELHADAEKLRP
jgi:hypothetical protein